MNGTLVLGSLREASRNGLGAAVLMLLMLAMVVVPLPPLLLDVLFTFNIALGLVVLLGTVYVRSPLELAAFPTRCCCTAWAIFMSCSTPMPKKPPAC